MKAVVLKNWNMMRMLRLVIGIFIISQGMLAQEWALIAMGSIFSALAVLNIGCCDRCLPNTPKARNHKSVAAKEITFEEVK